MAGVGPCPQSRGVPMLDVTGAVPEEMTSMSRPVPCSVALVLAACAVPGGAGCGSLLPAVAEVPVQETKDWRIPEAEWNQLHGELLRCRRQLEGLSLRYSSQQQAYTAYNAVGALTGLTGASAA